jgi:formylmethanofuran dehydrogenase subunit D
MQRLDSGSQRSLFNGYALAPLRSRSSTTRLHRALLADPRQHLPTGPQWVHEIKHDGFRFICRRDGERVRVFSRRGHDWTDRVPLIAEALAKLRVRSVTIDGEGVVCRQDGVSDFDRLRAAVGRLGSRDAFLYAFDLLEMDGEDLRRHEWHVRRATLRSLIKCAGPGVRLSEHIDGDGALAFRHACWRASSPSAATSRIAQGARRTSMNGERRMRLTERYMDPPGRAMPDCLIAARIANNIERVLREQGKNQQADQFKDFDWKTEEDAFMDGYAKHEKGGEFVTYARLRAMGTNGFQEPAIGLEPASPVAGGTSTGGPGEVLQGPAIEGARGKEPVQKDVPTQTGAPARAAAGTERIIGTKRLYSDGKFNTKDGKASFMETQWRGLQAPGKQAEMEKWPFLVNNGRTNIAWQSSYLDQDNEFVMDRFPYPFIQMNPQDMDELKLKAGDLVEIYNDNGSTQAIAYPTPTAKRRQTFMLFANPNGVQGNVVSPGVNEFIIPNYKQTWGAIRKIADAPEAVRSVTFKSQEYSVS